MYEIYDAFLTTLRQFSEIGDVYCRHEELGNEMLAPPRLNPEALQCPQTGLRFLKWQGHTG